MDPPVGPFHDTLLTPRDAQTLVYKSPFSHVLQKNQRAYLLHADWMLQLVNATARMHSSYAQYILLSYRHPETAGRPSFSHLASVLSQPDKGLLVWSDEDKNCHPQALMLGAPLEAGTHLYPLLQKTYMRIQA